MPGLTVTEKEHWKDRISRRIDKRIEAISAVEPNLMDRVQREARARALTSLGLAELQAEHDEIERQEEILEARGQEIDKAMLARVRGVPVASLEDRISYGGKTEVNNTVTRRQKVHEDELLAESEVGRQILSLREERDELLDTVWLATSGTHIRQLWQRVGELLGDQLTKLQHEALAIEPVNEE